MVCQDVSSVIFAAGCHPALRCCSGALPQSTMALTPAPLPRPGDTDFLQHMPAFVVECREDLLVAQLVSCRTGSWSPSSASRSASGSAHSVVTCRAALGASMRTCRHHTGRQWTETRAGGRIIVAAAAGEPCLLLATIGGLVLRAAARLLPNRRPGGGLGAALGYTICLIIISCLLTQEHPILLGGIHAQDAVQQ